jgi:hypothetical protein
MSAPTRPVPSEQQRAFELALAEELGVDPTRFGLVQWKTDGDRARVELFTIMPTDRLLELFNGAAHE